MPGSAVAELVGEYATRFSARRAVTIVGADARTQACMTYADLDRGTRALAAHLRELAGPGARALLAYPTGLEFVVALMACLYAGVTAVPAPVPGGYPHQRRRVASIATDAGVAAVLTDAENLADVAAWAGAAGVSRHQVHATSSAGSCGCASTGGAGQDRFVPPAIDRSALAMLQYTSGSTSEPKGVMLTHDNLIRNAVAVSGCTRPPRPARFCGWGPLYHDMGLAMLLTPLLLGGSSVLMSPLTFIKHPYSWLKVIDQQNIEVSAAPDFAYDLCVRQLTDAQIAGLDLSRWRCAVNASEPVRAATLSAFAARMAPAGFRAEAFCPAYGLAEATVYVSGQSGRRPAVTAADARRLDRGELVPASPGEPAKELVSCGPATALEVTIVDPRTRQEMADGCLGEIWVRGGSVAAGYWRDAEATATTFGAVTADGRGGYLRTGDIGACRDGEFFVTGRLTEMLIVHGRNVYPQDLELHARTTCPALASLRGAAFAVATSPGSEARDIVLVHEVRGGLSQPQLSDLARTIRRSIAAEMGVRISGIVLVRPGQVRRTTSGKVERTATRDLLVAGALAVKYSDLSLPVAELAAR